MSELPEPDPDLELDPFSRKKPENAVQQEWREVFDEATPGLRAFLRSRLAQTSDVDDCIQVVFIKMMESGLDVKPAARRAWLFRVAANESARLWRKKASTNRMLEKRGVDDELVNSDPADRVILNETTEKLYQALNELPEDWQRVVRLRIVENLTFQKIADQLDIPLGTALTRMRRALERLRGDLEQSD
jgi:RNA polymerase sigma-70 factor (ECF subfamily)